MPFIQQEAIRRVVEIGVAVKKKRAPQLKSTAAHELETGTPETMLKSAYPDLHVQRSPDQFFYTGMEDTMERDQDQIISKLQHRRMTEEPTIIVVDQLWLWIPNKGTTLTNTETHLETH